MKVKLKTFKYNGTLKKEFSNVEDAQKFAELMASRFPDMILSLILRRETLGKTDVLNLIRGTSKIQWGNCEETSKINSGSFLKMSSRRFKYITLFQIDLSINVFQPL